MKTVKGERGAIHTSTWFHQLPKGFQRVGISLYKPRGFKGEHWEIKALAPGRWYNTVDPETYVRLYSAVLAKLDPATIRDALFHIGPNPVMVCYESPVDIHAGTKFCHRHMAAEWLEQNLGIEVKEIDVPALDRWKSLRRIAVPGFATGDQTWPGPPEPVNILAGG